MSQFDKPASQYPSWAEGVDMVPPEFSLECFFNEYLPAGGDGVHAIVTMKASGTGQGRANSGLRGAEVIIVDVSESMSGAKLQHARLATQAAINAIHDGIPFAIIAGNHTARQVYPTLGLVPATGKTRTEAASFVQQLRASGGTAIGEWISLATGLLNPADGVRHALLLTDGKDEHESPDAMNASLAAAAGVFQCDCRGIGTDWDVAELRRVATALLGTVDMVAKPEDLTEDFRRVMRHAMNRAVADVRLRLWLPAGARLVLLKQVAPDLAEVGGGEPVNESTRDYPTGSWADESRDYHLALTVQPGQLGEEMLAARLSAVTGGEVVCQASITARWTDDPELSTRINRRVAHYTGQEELAEAIKEGLEAWRTGDHDRAEVRLGLAARLAAEGENDETAHLLSKVVDVDDWTTGRVRLKAQVDLADEMTLEARSTRTTRILK